MAGGSSMNCCVEDKYIASEVGVAASAGAKFQVGAGSVTGGASPKDANILTVESVPLGAEGLTFGSIDGAVKAAGSVIGVASAAVGGDTSAPRDRFGALCHPT